MTMDDYHGLHVETQQDAELYFKIEAAYDSEPRPMPRVLTQPDFSLSYCKKLTQRARVLVKWFTGRKELSDSLK